MTFWLLNINCLFFVNLFVRPFFYNERFNVAVYEGPQRATE